MAKSFKRMLATVLVMCMFLSVLPTQALAAEDDVVTTETEIKQEGDLTTHISTTTTVSNGDSTPTVTVEVQQSHTTGSTAPGVTIDRTQETSSTTVTHKDESNNVVSQEVVHKREETTTTTNTVTENSVSTQTEVDGREFTKVDMPLPESGVEVDVPLTEGQSNSETFSDAAGTITTEGDLPENENDTDYDYTNTEIIEQGKVTITNKDVTITEEFESTENDLDHIKSEATPDATNDLVHAGDVAPEAYLPGYEGEAVIPEGAENDGYDYVIVGSGNTSKYVPAIVFTTPLSDEDKLALYGDNAYIGTSYRSYYISHLPQEEQDRIAKDENGNYVTDEDGYILDIDGNRILKEERTAIGPNGEVTYLHRFDNYNDTLSVEGWYDAATGEWVKELNGDEAFTAVWAGPQQFILVDDEGNIVTTYCADSTTPTQESFGYYIENLEESDYYTEKEAEMIRSIAKNGYWGTEDGTGSLESMKEQLLATGAFTEEELESLTDGVALSATQMAIWTYSNKMSGIQFVNSHYSNWGVGNVPEAQEDEVTLLFKIYDYLINLEPTKTQNTTADTLINSENFVKDLSVTVIEMDKDHANNKDYDTSNDAYTTKVSFSLVVAPSGSDQDNLVAYLMDSDGNVMASGRIAGEGNEPMLPKDESGNYYFDNVTMVEGDQSFQLNLSGVQYLEEGVYLYTSEITDDNVSSQTMVGLASGDRGVNVTMDIQFDLDVEGVLVTERVWHDLDDPTVTPPPSADPPSDPPAVPASEDPGVQTTVFRVNNQEENLEVIPEEPVPLAAPVITGDTSDQWIVLILMTFFFMVVVNIDSKKRQHEAF